MCKVNQEMMKKIDDLQEKVNYLHASVKAVDDDKDAIINFLAETLIDAAAELDRISKGTLDLSKATTKKETKAVLKKLKSVIGYLTQDN